MFVRLGSRLCFPPTGPRRVVERTRYAAPRALHVPSLRVQQRSNPSRRRSREAARCVTIARRQKAAAIRRHRRFVDMLDVYADATTMRDGNQHESRECDMLNCTLCVAGPRAPVSRDSRIGNDLVRCDDNHASRIERSIECAAIYERRRSGESNAVASPVPQAIAGCHAFDRGIVRGADGRRARARPSRCRRSGGTPTKNRRSREYPPPPQPRALRGRSQQTAILAHHTQGPTYLSRSAFRHWASFFPACDISGLEGSAARDARRAESPWVKRSRRVILSSATLPPVPLCGLPGACAFARMWHSIHSALRADAGPPTVKQRWRFWI